MQTIESKYLDLDNAELALDLGCGEGRHCHAIIANGRTQVIGIDISYADLNKARQGAGEVFGKQVASLMSVLAGDALSLPLPDACLDVVICSEVLEHIHDYQGVLSEISRITRPGGRLAISVPRAFPEWICWRLSNEYPNTPGGHIRIFKKQNLLRDIESKGFSFQAQHGAHALHSPYWWLRCLFWKTQDDNRLIARYKQFLEWDILKRPLFTRILEKLTRSFLGKSIVLYFEKTPAKL